jgi:hypothetical protein
MSAASITNVTPIAVIPIRDTCLRTFKILLTLKNTGFRMDIITHNNIKAMYMPYLPKTFFHAMFLIVCLLFISFIFSTSFLIQLIMFWLGRGLRLTNPLPSV